MCKLSNIFQLDFTEKNPHPACKIPVPMDFYLSKKVNKERFNIGLAIYHRRTGLSFPEVTNKLNGFTVPKRVPVFS